MAWNKEDRSFKILINKRVTDENKAFYEEFGDNTLDVSFDEVKTQTIPFDDPSAGIAQNVVEKRELFVMTKDNTVSGDQSYYAYDTTENIRLKDWISDKYGLPYAMKLYDNNDNEIFATDASEWFFDYPTGILTFNGSTNSFTKPFKITAYRYIGSKGGNIGGAKLLTQTFTSISTISDGDLAMNSTLGGTPQGDIYVTVNGNQIDVYYNSSDGIANDAIFTSPDGSILRQKNEIRKGDVLRWYGSVAGYQLSSMDKIKITYITDGVEVIESFPVN